MCDNEPAIDDYSKGRPVTEGNFIKTADFPGNMDQENPSTNNESTSSAPQNMRSRAHELCSQFLGGPWDEIKPSEMQFVPITEGLSNFLYLCALPSILHSDDSSCMLTPPSSEQVDDDTLTDELRTGKSLHSFVDSRRIPHRVLVRIYGPMAEEDMSQESVIFMLLSERRLGPKLYGVFKGGRLEEYLPALPITEDQMKQPDISDAIARKMATIHSLEVPISKRADWLYTRLDEWASWLRVNITPDYIESNLRHNPHWHQIANEFLSIDFQSEISWIKSVAQACPSPLVFSHNDLLNNNILMYPISKRRASIDERLVFIDFEYCSYNFRGFDIANHFCEWCVTYLKGSFKADHEKFPSIEEQRRFAHSYLLKVHELERARASMFQSESNSECYREDNDNDNECHDGKTEENEHSHQTSEVENGNTIHEVSISGPLSNSEIDSESLEREVDHLIEEVATFSLASHMLWGLWCIQLAHCGKIDFDFWSFAHTRISMYKAAKRDFQGNPA